jgi:ribonucleoside-diphosphate reductase alpha chain
MSLELLKSAGAARDIFQRYLRRDQNGHPCETVEQSFERVAWNIAAHDTHPADFYEHAHTLLFDLLWVPNRPAWYGLGMGGFTSACTFFAMEDSLIDGDRSIVETLRKGAAVQQAGGGVGWDVSELRPAGDIVKGSGGKATGPVGFIQGIDPFLLQISQGGRMMGANNVSLNVDHPDILEFIALKTEEHAATQFNTNVLLTDAFMGDPDPEVWDALIHAMWENGGVGVQFIDTANRANAIPGYGPLRGTNPCSEFWMFSGESCQPGYINLAAMVRDGAFDWELLEYVTVIATRAMDNLVDANGYLDSVPELKRMAKATRRMGIGPTGLADAMILLGLRYGSPESLDFASQVMEFILYHALYASAELARERGSFPLFEQSVYHSGDWQPPTCKYNTGQGFGRPVIDWRGAAEFLAGGMRNCGVTVIAPSSFGSQTMGTEGYGCEPIFAPDYVRNHGDGSAHAQGSVLRDMPAFVAAHEVTPEQHVAMLEALQPYVTESISKTVNLPHSATVADVEAIVQRAHAAGLKNIIVYRAQSRRDEALVVTPCRECSEENGDCEL